MSSIREVNKVSECRQDKHVDASVSLNHIATTCIDSTVGRSPHNNSEHVTTSTEPSEQSYCGFTDSNTDSPRDRPYQLIEHVQDHKEAVYDEPDNSDNDSAKTGYFQPVERGKDFAEAMYLTLVTDGNGDNLADAANFEPGDFDNDLPKSTLLERIDGGDNPTKTAHSELFNLAETSKRFASAEADYSEPTDLAEAGYSEIGRIGDDSSAKAAQHLFDAEEPYEDLDVAANDDSSNPAYGGQVQGGNDDSANPAYDGQVRYGNDDSANPAYGGQEQVASNDSVNSARDNIGDAVKLLFCNS